MKVILVALLVSFIGVESQVHYIPAHILIPTYNISNYPQFYNLSGPGWNNTARNGTQWNNNWNNTSFNKSVPGQLNQTTANGDVLLGQIGYADRLLFNQIYLKTRRWWSSREKIIEYPKDLPGKHDVRHDNITAIRIYNKFYDGLESKAEILSGGVGQRYVKIKLSSNWGKGFKYLVQIFGR